MFGVFSFALLAILEILKTNQAGHCGQVAATYLAFVTAGPYKPRLLPQYHPQNAVTSRKSQAVCWMISVKTVAGRNLLQMSFTVQALTIRLKLHKHLMSNIPARTDTDT